MERIRSAKTHNCYPPKGAVLIVGLMLLLQSTALPGLKEESWIMLSSGSLSFLIHKFFSNMGGFLKYGRLSIFLKYARFVFLELGYLPVLKYWTRRGFYFADILLLSRESWKQTKYCEKLREDMAWPTHCHWNVETMKTSILLRGMESTVTEWAEAQLYMYDRQ